ncbi:MAG: hypothetical protein SPJ24_00030 [Agathobaculum butyriciproducens]|nr:hypothetical protein [Agathobaculum butyriciproducens]
MLFRRKQEITHADTTVRARAKINLTLDVTGRREDGYHTVEMVMQSIALHDTVRVTTIHGEKKPRGIVLSCSLPFLPTDERNLAYRAAELFYMRPAHCSKPARFTSKSAFRLRQVWRAARRMRRLFCVRSTHCIQPV